MASLRKLVANIHPITGHFLYQLVELQNSIPALKEVDIMEPQNTNDLDLITLREQEGYRNAPGSITIHDGRIRQDV